MHTAPCVLPSTREFVGTGAADSEMLAFGCVLGETAKEAAADHGWLRGRARLGGGEGERAHFLARPRGKVWYGDTGKRLAATLRRGCQ